MTIFFMHSIIMWPVECKQGCIFCQQCPVHILSSFGLIISYHYYFVIGLDDVFPGDILSC